MFGNRLYCFFVSVGYCGVGAQSSVKSSTLTEESHLKNRSSSMQERALNVR